MGLDAYLADWRPGPVTEHDELGAGPAVALAGVLGADRPTGSLPPLWHWLYFLDWPPQHELGEDGHPREGRFLPPIPGRRRMFAGGRLEVHGPLLLDEPADKSSRLGGAAVKQGGTGEMAFVTVRSEIRQGARLKVVEEQDIVYRSGEDERRRGRFQLSEGEAAGADAGWQRTLRPDSRLLFRLSALTANSHRIHYDEPYARGTEGYPGLVVHGPLLALLMLELVRDKRIRSLSYRLRHPVFAGEHLRAVGEPAETGASLRVATAREERAATAEVVYA